MKCFDSFYEEASYALSRLLKVEPELADTGCGVCHGAYHYHNVLILPDYSVATVNFESMCYQPYLLDLYHFLRKTLEKNHYDYSFFEAGISGYSIYRRLAEKDFLFLYLLFLYPEKFWKLANQYYNCRKACLSGKNGEKLKKLAVQEEKRGVFLRQML